MGRSASAREADPLRTDERTVAGSPRKKPREVSQEQTRSIRQSFCNACGEGCDPFEKTDTTWLPTYSDKKTGKGCGIEFTHIAMSWRQDPAPKSIGMRPDLELIALPRDAD